MNRKSRRRQQHAVLSIFGTSKLEVINATLLQTVPPDCAHDSPIEERKAFGNFVNNWRCLLSADCDFISQVFNGRRGGNELQ